MKKAMVVIAGLGLASGIPVVAQEQEDQEFNPNRDIVTEQGSASAGAGTASDPSTGSTTASGETSGPTSGETSAATSTNVGVSALTADELEGMKVVTLTGEEIGEIGAVGETGEGRVATVEVGGFLGVGEKTIAIPLSELTRSATEEDSVRTSLTRAEIDSQPAVDDSIFTPDE